MRGTRSPASTRRARFLPPGRLYLICSLGFFLLNALPKPGQDDAEPDLTVRATPAAGAPEGRRAASARESSTPVEARIERGYGRVKGGERSLKAMIWQQIPNAMFVLVPLHAAMLALLHRGRRLRYPAHVVFALHAHAFFFGVLALNELLEVASVAWGRLDGIAGLATFGWLLAYFPFAMRRVYGGRRRAAVLRALALGSLYATAALGLCSVAVLGYLYWMGRQAKRPASRGALRA